MLVETVKLKGGPLDGKKVEIPLTCPHIQFNIHNPKKTAKLITEDTRFVPNEFGRWVILDENSNEPDWIKVTYQRSVNNLLEFVYVAAAK